MKKTQKLIIFSLLAFVLCTVALSFWYQSLHYLTEVNFIKVITNVGIIGAVVPTLFLALIYYLTQKNMNKTSRIYLIIILSLFLFFSVYNLTLVMVFYDINDSKTTFLKSLLEIF